MSKTKQKHLKDVLPMVYDDLLIALGTPRALSLLICKRYEAIAENLHLFEVNPSDYVVAHPYWADAQAVAIFKKNLYLKGIKTQDELHDECVEKFYLLEAVNAETNRTIISLKDFKDVSLLERARRIINDVLGSTPPVDRYRPAFGKGSTFSLPACQSTIADKLDNNIDATPHAAIYVQDCMIATPRLFPYFENPLEIVGGNRFSSVPKDFRKRRPISVEPMFNMLLQKNIGDFIRFRLRRVGIDINSQQDFHKWILMNQADIYSTIDQSDASDRISTELVRALLPPEWFTYLNRIRSRKTKMTDDKWVELNKFASQGNGFIFELETLIFYSIAKAAIDYHTQDSVNCLVSAYGDDVIVPEQFFHAVVNAYERFGFKVNTEKSFHTGPFKESCGVDIFYGEDVRPVYLKEFSVGLAGFYEAANYVSRLARRHLSGVGYCKLYLRAWHRIVSCISEKRRYGGPEELGDAVIHGLDWKPTSKGFIQTTRGIKRTYHRKDFKTPFKEQSLLAYIVFGYSDSGVLKRGARYKCNETDYVVRTTQVIGWF